ncbi:predicted protein [Pyrenophora tritici-repentis Pt-1C-BFP]|uniref:Uncharacterized protein n=1 Tax=Pyrenophora tritici-repentis (strain Pt-1C-BFP) TaxID=426418 RepID=B2WDT5_PYRTR|nr:uncharacterized protein PTRG_08308 [Pyrenophora tritici-repentis Pt-1C-BFP]EDU51227.1 predicted protein [Pyrenophora tritici-repentis Pt-1C-BFP]
MDCLLCPNLKLFTFFVKFGFWETDGLAASLGVGVADLNVRQDWWFQVLLLLTNYSPSSTKKLWDIRALKREAIFKWRANSILIFVL